METTNLQSHYLFKVLILCLLFGISTHSIFAQAKSNLVVITMLNNSQIRGEIIGKTSDHILVVQQGASDTLTIKKAFITNLIDTQNKLVFKGGKYHVLTGWTLSINYAAGLNELGKLNRQQSFQVYNMRSSSLGVGGGMSIKLHPGMFEESWDRWDYKFIDFFAYGKYYLNSNQRRLYVDSKLGYAIPLGKHQDVISTRPVISNTLSYTSGFILQPGIGLQFAGKKAIKWGIKIDAYLQEMREWNNERTINNVNRRYLYGALIGINFYM